MFQPGNSPRVITLAAAVLLFCGKAEANPADLVLRGEGTIKDANAPSDGVLFKISYVHTIKQGRPFSTLIQQFDLSGELLVDVPDHAAAEGGDTQGEDVFFQDLLQRQ